MQRIHVTIRPLNREDSVLYFPPEAFGPFRVLHQIGAGTLGPVFRAYEPADAADERRDRLVAVKVFRLDLIPEQVAALVAELDTLVSANIHHPNIAAPIAAGLEHGAAYLAQEYAVGDSLDVVLRERGPMSMREVAALVDSLADAIDHAAERGVHHGLLHLRDIVLSADTVRITGFGIAGALSKIGAKLPTRPQYSSPDAASDVYSLGAIAFEVATGKRVSADNLKEFEAEHGTVLRGAFGLPLAANPDVRPARARDFAEALLGALGAMGARGATGATGALGARGATGATGAKGAKLAPNAPNAPNAPSVPKATVGASEDPLDRVIDLAPPDALELDALSVSMGDKRSAPSLFRSSTNIELNPPSWRWPIVAPLVAIIVIAALSVGYLLRSRSQAPAAEQTPGVNATTVDLPAPAPNAPDAPNAPTASTSAPPAHNATVDKPVAPDASASAPPASPELRRDKPVAPNAPGSPGRILIRSTPADADVLVNGKPRGKTPLALRDLALGSYTIRVARDGYVTEDLTLQLTSQRPTSSTTIDLRSQKAGPGGLTVQSRPAGARVFVNNRLAGSTPIAIPGLPAGPATVRIELDGYQPWATRVSVAAGEQTRVSASLERGSGARGPRDK